jgi:hypothetical protein
MRTAYFDCFSGASGDMIIGALLDAGLDFQYLEHELAKLNLSHYTLRCMESFKAGFRGTRFVVQVDQHYHRDSHRHLEDIVEIINRSFLSETIKNRSIEVFQRLAEAEATVHASSVAHVHFHEVGAIDAIIDIVGAIIGITALDIGKVCCSSIHVGAGTVKCEHGILPVPAPATAELLKGIPFYSTEVAAELLTPTGAAILTTLTSTFGPMQPMTVEKIGYGGGTLDLDSPNMLRLFIGENTETADACETEKVAVLETNIDDMNPQVYEHVVDKLRRLGALEVWLCPIQMKKNRPGTLVTVVCKPDLVQTLSAVLLSETTSLGLRWRVEDMLKVPTEIAEFPTEYGTIRYKMVKLGDTVTQATPEYEDCRRIAREHDIPLKEIMLMANRRIDAFLNEH